MELFYREEFSVLVNPVKRTIDLITGEDVGKLIQNSKKGNMVKYYDKIMMNQKYYSNELR